MRRRRRIRHHVNPLSVHHMDTGARRLSLPPGRSLEAELGCAEGEFLFARAAVAPESGDSLLLEDLVQPRLAADPGARIAILAGPGGGKTTALRHLSAALSGSPSQVSSPSVSNTTE